MKKTTILFLLSFGIWVNAIAQSITTTAVKTILLQQGLSLSDVNDLVITNQYTSKHNGVTQVYFRQKFNGIEVFNGVGSVHFKQGNPSGLNHSFVPNIAEKAKSLQVQITPSA